MSRDLGRDVPDLEKLYARKLWAHLSYPTCGLSTGRENPLKQGDTRFLPNRTVFTPPPPEDSALKTYLAPGPKAH